ncbi:MAG: nucleotidyltransferase domain-containing protein [Candidatus Paceibacterota bacterium]|jgi:predicted nucleotidyltransferase
MKKWEIVVEKFLDEWRDKPEVLGAIVGGSHAVGNETDLSDIDLQVVLKNDIPWRDRGLTCIDGIIIEYFLVPIGNYKIYSEQGINRDQIKVDARIFSTGKVVLDKDGSMAELVKEAYEKLKKEFPVYPDEAKALMQKHLWDTHDHLEEYTKYPSPMFGILYGILLNDILEFYARVTRTERLPLERAHKLITNEVYRERYGFPRVSDKKFETLLLSAIEKQDFANIDALYTYAQELGGGFDQCNWYLRRKSLVQVVNK